MQQKSISKQKKIESVATIAWSSLINVLWFLRARKSNEDSVCAACDRRFMGAPPVESESEFQLFPVPDLEIETIPNSSLTSSEKGEKMRERENDIAKD